MQGAVTCVLCLEREPNSEIAVPLLLTGSADASIKVWDPMVVREPGGTKAAPCIQVSAAPPRAPSADSSASPQRPVAAPSTLLTRSSHLRGGRTLRAGAGPQRAGDAPSYTDACTATQTMVGHGGTVTALARVGAYVFSCSTDCKVMLWRAASGREATLYPWFELQVGALALHRRHGTLPSSPKIQSLQAPLTLSSTPHTHVLIRFSLSSPHMHKP
jgi:WD40 repeat protein